MTCSGIETSLEDCENDGIGVASCGHANDAGVRCQGYLLAYIIDHLNSLLVHSRCCLFEPGSEHHW